MARPRRLSRKWIEWPNERLLDVRIADLPLRIRGTELSANIRRLYAELKARGFRFRPHFWLSDEWFSPDGVPGIAIPFFLAHPRLRRLERDMMLEVEGESAAECMKLLRHEAGHALLNAYQLNRRRDWQQHFGRSSLPYPDTYVPRPYSKRYVLHLPNWYAQAHPHEDWAETFAVWLKPNSDWRKRYRDWPAIKKLEYVDRLMQEIRDRPPKLRNRREVLPLKSLRLTLREYYAEKQKRYGRDRPEFSDIDLTKLFSNAEEHKANERASQYIRRNRAEVIDIVARWTSEYHYRINQVLQEMIDRCDALNLRVADDDAVMRPNIVACLTAMVLNKLHSGGFRVSL
ncbi:MAG TPA: putative zinc-binding metallopeptidase [Burkholderiales bacterium]